MTNKSLSLGALFAAMIGFANGPADAAPCGNNSAGFEGWKRALAGEASGNGPAQGDRCAHGDQIFGGNDQADRGQKSSSCFDQFMAKRGGLAIAARARHEITNAGLFASDREAVWRTGGPIIAIGGMETAFGNPMGSQPTISAVANSPMTAAGRNISPTSLRRSSSSIAAS
jgi:membrane-bound lytic murein transglycosylase B